MKPKHPGGFRAGLGSPVKGSMLEGKRYSRTTRSQSGSGGSLGGLGILTGCPKSLKGSSKSFSSASSAAAGASPFFSTPGGGGGGGALLGAAEIRQKPNGQILSSTT